MSLRFAALPAAVILLLSLAACTGGSGGTGGSGSDEATPAAQDSNSGELATACIAGIWNLDTNDTAQATLQYLIAKGAPVTDARGDGPVVLHISSDGTATYQSGVTYEFTATTHGVGIDVQQSQIGDSQGEWGWTDSGDTIMGFTGWSNNIQITNTAQVGGTGTNFAIPLPDLGPGSAPLHVICTSETLQTRADEQPFPLNWTRG
ncbi:MAG: hypothetical protein ABJA94_11815 [Rhodoglobus sp.]